jgi:hypothetical protein
MKKVLVLLCLLVGFAVTQAQGFKAGFGVGYVSEIESIAGSIDLIYELNEKWGVSNTTMFTVNELPNNNRLKWLAFDLNARYKVYKEFYVLAGGQFMSESLLEKQFIGGFVSGETTVNNAEFGGNIGAGYKYHLISNVNIFAEIKYTLINSEPVNSSGYVHGRLGMVFDF